MTTTRQRLGLAFRIAVVLGPITSALIVAYAVRSAYALGIPTLTPLAYTGTLMTYGAPDNSSHTMWLGLFVSGANDGGSGSAACTTAPAQVACQNGQFTIPLTSNCLSVFQQNANVQVEVNVDGVNMGLVSVAAVPYAVEAGSVPASGVSGVLPIASGGTGSSTQNFVDLSSTQTAAGTKSFSGSVAIGTSGAPTTTLEVAGDITATGSFFHGAATTGLVISPTWSYSVTGPVNNWTTMWSATVNIPHQSLMMITANGHWIFPIQWCYASVLIDGNPIAEQGSTTLCNNASGCQGSVLSDTTGSGVSGWIPLSWTGYAQVAAGSHTLSLAVVPYNGVTCTINGSGILYAAIPD